VQQPAESPPFDPRALPVRWSNLHRIAQSPAHYLHALQHERRDTPAMRFGRLVHALLLGKCGGGHGGEVVVWTGERRGNAWKMFAEEHLGAEIVTEEEYERASRCAGAIEAHPRARNVLVGNLEHEVRWTNAGRQCLGHVDAGGFNWVTELKTSTNASPDWFRRQALGMSYHAQLAWYADALSTLGRRIDVAHIAVVEVQAPHAVTVFTLTPRALEEGRKLNRLWWEKLMVCEASNEWPGYVQHDVPLDVAEAGLTLTLPDGEEVAA
jgi:PDDEXK-like domain of unknown function (DUF3799)